VNNRSESNRSPQPQSERDVTAAASRRAAMLPGPTGVPEKEVGFRSGTAGLPGRLTATSYPLPADLGYEAWVRDGELSAQAIEEMTGYQRSTVQNYAYVCRAIQPPRRREELPFAHHYEVARIAREDPDLADELLELAVQQKLTRDELRGEVRRVTRERALAQPAPGDDRLPSDVTLQPRPCGWL
jgi:hypothetical protein